MTCCPFEDSVSVREAGELAQATFLLQTPLPACSGLPPLPLAAAAAAGSSPLDEDCTLLLKHLDFICITIFHTLFSHSLSPHLHGFSIAGGVTVPCAPHGLRAAAELGWSSGLVVTEELGTAVLSLSQPSRGASTGGARCWESLGGAMDLC